MVLVAVPSECKEVTDIGQSGRGVRCDGAADAGEIARTGRGARAVAVEVAGVSRRVSGTSKRLARRASR